MIPKTKNQLIHKIRRTILIDIESQKHSVQLKDLINDDSTVVLLNEAGIFTISDLVTIDIFKLSSIDEGVLTEINSQINLLSKGLDSNLVIPERQQDIHPINQIELNSLEEVINSIEEKDRNIIIERYGLLGEKKKLNEIGEDLGVSRQRVHQIVERNLNDINKKYVPNHFIESENVSKLADQVIPIDAIGNLSNTYSNIGLIEFIIDAFPSLWIVIYNDKNLKTDILINKDLIKSLLNKISRVKSFLKQQKEFVSIQQISELFEINIEVIKIIDNTVIKNETIAIKTNKNIPFGMFGIIYDVIKSAGKPLKIQEIVKVSGLTQNQVRSRLDRDNGKFFINVGKSIYALSEWGFSKLQTNDLIYNYIKESNEPKSIMEILRFVRMHKRINDSSIIAAISIDPRIVTIRPKTYSLIEWGAKPYHTRSGTKYAINCYDALISILSEVDTDLTISEICNLLNDKYGDDVTSSQTTIYANLKKLKESGRIEFIINYGKQYYKYKLIKV